MGKMAEVVAVMCQKKKTKKKTMKAGEGNKERNNENKLHVFEMFFLLCIFVKVIVCMHGAS